MFRFFDGWFGEEVSKDPNAKDFGIKESTWLQRGVRKEENESIFTYSEEEVSRSIVHTREDLVLLYAQLNRTNIILRWIRWLLVILILTLWEKL